MGLSPSIFLAEKFFAMDGESLIRVNGRTPDLHGARHFWTPESLAVIASHANFSSIIESMDNVEPGKTDY